MKITNLATAALGIIILSTPACMHHPTEAGPDGKAPRAYKVFFCVPAAANPLVYQAYRDQSMVLTKQSRGPAAG